jgi:rubrerythrin
MSHYVEMPTNFFRFPGLSFVHAAFTELLECRSFLQHSYAFAFFRYPTLYYISRNRVIKMRHREKATFEQLQSGLEMLTEQMSDIVARTHLRATQTQIMFLTCEAAEKRRDLSNFLIAILDDERKEQAESENEGNENDAQRRSIPPPIDIGGMLARLHSRAPVGNEHDDMDSDDNGVSYPYPGHRFQRRNLEEEDAAMQEALQASLQAFIAESQSPDTDGDNEEAEGPVVGWSCEACTYMNSRGRTCAMCGTARDHP